MDLSQSEDRLIAAIYTDAQTRLREPHHLEQLISDLDRIDWFSAQKDGLGDLYEGLLEKNANETKSGAGQYLGNRGRTSISPPSGDRQVLAGGNSWRSEQVNSRGGGLCIAGRVGLPVRCVGKCHEIYEISH
ncbi:hypothetical protein MKP05_12760 [Halomonas sp. EGI 63088]|uniref:Uncharacterized protein n=1 Tax=Halomonas flagellata TaxID=2920385 RepID=A0ABS9RVX7_9GAMM|nr:hypothetical protein [Halomonas flagellata]MCH4563997.1 hypothetical protein [Halomonas flagellata]